MMFSFFPAPPGTGILGATSLGTSIEPPSSAVSSGGNGASSILPPGGIGLGVKPPSPEQPLFMCPRRPNIGREGRAIPLRANHFQITMPRGYIHHYHISITPDKCPRKVNRDIIGKYLLFINEICENIERRDCYAICIGWVQKNGPPY